MNICPEKAISMKEDEYGFIYPVIDGEKCIACRRCQKVCAFRGESVENAPISTYAAVSRDEKTRMLSSSGGMFAAMAEYMIGHGGIVIGAIMQEDFSVIHAAAEKQEDIRLLQGSKYTQSSTGDVYQKTAEYLADGKKVLFSGTPYQTAGLYGFLGRDYENLLTVDIICHGVPGGRMFREYIELLGRKYGGRVEEFTFRDKSLGWGKNGSALINNKRRKIWQNTSSYIYYFSRGWIFRDSCCSCRYSSRLRPSDITLGDYWGIEKQHPEYLDSGIWNENKGISVVLANTGKGQEFLDGLKDLADLKSSRFSSAAAGNSALVCPVSAGKREEILECYKNGGWASVEQRFRKSIGLRYYSSQIKALLPERLRRKLKGR